MKIRQQYINLSKKYAGDTDQYNLYIDKAQSVDVSSC